MLLLCESHLTMFRFIDLFAELAVGGLVFKMMSSDSVRRRGFWCRYR